MFVSVLKHLLKYMVVALLVACQVYTTEPAMTVEVIQADGSTQHTQVDDSQQSSFSLSQDLRKKWDGINLSIQTIHEACQKPNFYQLESETKIFVKKIRQARDLIYKKHPLNHQESGLFTIDVYLEEGPLDEMNNFIHALEAAIDTVCAPKFCHTPPSKKAHHHICVELKETLQPIIKQLNLMCKLCKLPLSKTNYKLLN